MKPILSVRDFATRIGTPIELLYRIAENPKKHYRHWSKWNADKSKSRNMNVPDAMLMEIQRRINEKIFVPLGASSIAYGGVRGGSPRKNAMQHLGQPCLVTLDVKEFFGSVRHGAVFNMLRRQLGFGRDVASLITRLTTLHDELPTGAPTSPYVGNLVLAVPLDGPLSRIARERAIRVGRFVDDISLSGENPQALINATGLLLSRCGLRMYRRKAFAKSKLKITHRSRPQEVTGLLVNGSSGPTVSRQRRDAVRAAIFELKKVTNPAARDVALRSIRGKIAYVEGWPRLLRQISCADKWICLGG